MMIALALVGFVGFISKAALTGLRAQPSTAGSIALMKIGLLYSTTTGNTETVAGYIAEAADVDGPHDAGDVNNLSQFDGLIVGAPTWHTGADSERSGTSWDDWCARRRSRARPALRRAPRARPAPHPSAPRAPASAQAVQGPAHHRRLRQGQERRHLWRRRRHLVRRQLLRRHGRARRVL